MAVLNEETTIGGGSPLISNSAGILQWGDGNSQGIFLGRNVNFVADHFTDSVILGMDNTINYALYRFSIYGNANSINASGEDYIGIYGDCNTNDGGYSNYVYGYGNSIQGGYENYVYGSYNQVRSGHLNTILGTGILVSDDSDENILIGKKFDAAHALGLIAIISNGNNAVINEDGVIIAHEWAPEVGQSGYIHILNDEVNINGNVFINGADISQLVRSMVISTLNELPSSEE